MLRLLLTVTLLLTAVHVLVSAETQTAHNWPEFRGPHGDGHAEVDSLPVEWSEATHIAWKTPIAGRGWSSPVIWGRQIWLTTATPDGHELSAVCIDRDTGKVQFEQRMFHVAQPREIHKTNSYASVTPAIEEGRVYLSWGSYGIVCLDTTTFEPVWTRRDLECHHWRGPGSSPILLENLLIQHYDGYDYQYVIALDKSTGETVWRTERPTDFRTDDGDKKKAYATPIVIAVDGEQQLISPTSLGAFAYNPRTGEELWRITYDQFSTPQRPIYDGELLYFGTGFGKGNIIAVRPGGRGDLTKTHIAWTVTKSMPSKPSPVLIDGRLYTVDDQGVGTCLDAKTGDEIWKARIGGNYWASPLSAGGHIYYFSDEGKTTVITPGDEYNVVAENQLDEGFLASPAVADGALFLRTRTHLYRIDE